MRQNLLRPEPLYEQPRAPQLPRNPLRMRQYFSLFARKRLIPAGRLRWLKTLDARQRPRRFDLRAWLHQPSSHLRLADVTFDEGEQSRKACSDHLSTLPGTHDLVSEQAGNLR